MPKKVARAAGILKLAKSTTDMNVTTAMRYAGFNTPQLSEASLRRKVYRNRDSLQSEQDAANADATPSTKEQKAPRFTDFQWNQATKNLQEKIKEASNTTRLTARQASAVRDVKAKEKQLKSRLFKEACLLLQTELTAKEASIIALKDDPTAFAYKPKSAETICRNVFKTHGIKICARTVRNQVAAGHAGNSPNRRGPKGKIPLKAFKALCGAVETYATITQARGDMTVDRPRLIRMANACINKQEGQGARKDRWLFDRIQAEIGDVLSLGKPNRIEQRRQKWSTHSNINLWYDSLKEFLIDKGFAVKNPNSGAGGELTWVDNTQGRRICNLDESAIGLDNSKTQKGGRPAAVFYNKKLADCPIFAAHKASFHCTLLAGCFASGEKFPEHFQVPTNAERDQNKGVNSDFTIDFKETTAWYLYGEERGFSNTYGCNKKGGMNKKEFGKWVDKNLVKLVSGDCADIAGKRICVLVDGGPGRTNRTMLNTLRMLGIYLFPSGPPNTTHILQILDMLFGLFKSIYYENLEITWEYRQNDHSVPSTITKNDIGLLMYGSKTQRINNPNLPLLRNAVHEAFSHERIQHAWTKLGVYPEFTRAALQDPKVRHEVVVDSSGTANDDVDPQASFLQLQNERNTMCNDILAAFGYGGDIFRIQMTEFNADTRAKLVTKERTKERQ